MTSRRKMIEVEGKEVVVKEEEILKFQNEIESLVRGNISYLDAINEYCEKYAIEVETVKALISTNLMSKIYEEACMLNLIQGEQALPI